ncbi:MAG: hypothetical protein IPJ71_03040 [Bdellovibrionales bacterium]|nr:hypothetical protein [Bdellovibrionales bacterium]
MLTVDIRKLFILSLGIGVAASLSFFTSCDVYSENNLFAELKSSCVDTNSCTHQSSEFMELKINTENNYPVAVSDIEFDVAGDCNEGGFEQNLVLWELFLDNTLVQSSQNLGLGTTCVYGQFSARVRLPRAGLQDTTGVRREHRLDVELIGIDPNGELFKNPLMAKKSITVSPR